MKFDTGCPELGVVDVDCTYEAAQGCQVGKRDAGTDHAVTYLRSPGGCCGVVRTVGVLDRSPEAAERTRARLMEICARIV